VDGEKLGENKAGDKWVGEHELDAERDSRDKKREREIISEKSSALRNH